MKNRGDPLNLLLYLSACLLNCISISCNGRETILSSSYHLVSSVKNKASVDGDKTLTTDLSNEDAGLDSSYTADTTKNEFSRLNFIEEYSISLLYSEIDLGSKKNNDTILSSSYHFINSIKNESSDNGGKALNINFAGTSQDNTLDSSYVINTPKDEFSQLNFLKEYSIPLLNSEIDLRSKGQDVTILSSNYHVGNSITNEPLDDGDKRLNMNRSYTEQDSRLGNSDAHHDLSRLDVLERFTPQPSKGKEIIIITNIFESMDVLDNLHTKTAIDPMRIVSQHLKVRTMVVDKDPIPQQSLIHQSMKGKENMISTVSSILGRLTALPVPRFRNASFAKKSNTSNAYYHIPEKTYPIPKKTYSIPKKTHSIPKKTVAIPEKTDAIPEKTHSIPEKTHSIPKKTHFIDKKTDAIPEKTHSIPKKTDAIPEKTHSIPKKTDAIPKKTHSIPEKTHSIPKKTSSIPKKTSSIPKKTSSIPEKTSSIPKKTSSIPKKILPTTKRYTLPRITNTASFKMDTKPSRSSKKDFLNLSVLRTLVSKSHSSHIDENQISAEKTNSKAFKTLTDASKFSEIITVSVSTSVNASVNGTLPNIIANNHASLLVGAIFIPGLLVLYLTCRFLVPLAYEFGSEKC